MPNYEKLYHQLFIETDDAIKKLKAALEAAEERYLSMCEEEFPNGEDLESSDEEAFE